MSNPDGSLSSYTVEDLLPSCCQFVKFSNNTGVVSHVDFSALLQAFSHWTYSVAGRHLMVVDLQVNDLCVVRHI